MDFYNVVIGLFGALASLCTILWTIVGWVRTPDEIKQEVKAILRRSASRIYRVLGVLASLSLSVINGYAIARWTTSLAPLDRPEVVNLLMYIWNTVFYGLAFLIIITLWIKQSRDHKCSAVTDDR